MSALGRGGTSFLWVALLFLNPSAGWAQVSEKDPFQELQSRLLSVENQLKQIEAHQQAIAARDEQTLQELDRLRVWVHRMPGKK